MKLILNNDEVQCIGEDGLLWSIPINELVFIGEYTTSAGPWFDDWFYVFSNEYNTWYEVPFEAEFAGATEFWKLLGEKLNCELVPSLANSTVWKTNVIYPANLDGEELFTIITIPGKPRTFKQKIFGGNDDEEKLELTDKVKALFDQN
jgi:hypothetical protein